jgi:hypothetical protein
MVTPLQAGVRLTAIFDSCHSGSALDLPYIYSTQGVLKEPNLAKEAGQGLLGVLSVGYTYAKLPLSITYRIYISVTAELHLSRHFYQYVSDITS